MVSQARQKSQAELAAGQLPGCVHLAKGQLDPKANLEATGHLLQQASPNLALCQEKPRPPPFLVMQAGM